MQIPTNAARSALLTLASCCLVALSCTPSTPAHASEPPQLKTASTHPIQYYLSLPEGWTASKKWPVVVVIESADREFLQASTAFAQARGSRPFILVTPLVVTNGGAGFRNVPTYHYSNDVWELIQNSSQFQFDMDGITAIMKDMVQQYGGEDKFFITGLEAAGHTIWAVLFNHPEVVRAAALVCPNYQGRWIDEAHISNAPERVNLPIMGFAGTNDTVCAADKPIHKQITQAFTVARDHGYKNVGETTVKNKGHERLAEEILDYFSSLMH